MVLPAATEPGRGGQDHVRRNRHAFPIKGFDRRPARQIVLLLSDLSAAELIAVRNREQDGKRRVTILHKIDTLLGARSPGTDRESNHPPPFPIADYERLRASEVVALLAGLSPEEINQVEKRERAGAQRSTVLARIEGIRVTEGFAPNSRDPRQVSPVIPPIRTLHKTPPSNEPEARPRLARSRPGLAARLHRDER